ncbi:MAG: hypothetical protein WBF77_01370 [Sulfurimonadaceae bacterium]
MKKNRDNCSTEEVQSDKHNVSRRKFMKKAAYTAPKIIALGLLAQGKPSSAAFGGPPNAPGNSGQPW